MMALPATVLTAGDIVVLGWNSRDMAPDQKWAFMTMVDIAAGTNIIFTDNGYDATTSNFRSGATNEGFLSWTTPSAITKGTIIYCTNNKINGATTGVSGQLGGGLGGSGSFSTAGDQIIVYQGTSGTAVGATFIYALNTGQSNLYTGGNGTWLPNGSGALSADNLSYLPPGLTNGSTAVALTTNTTGISSGTGALGSANYGFDNMYYGGTTSGTKTSLLAAVATPTNWVGNNSTTTFAIQSGAGSVFTTGTFTILPVTLLYFNARLLNTNAVELTWATSRETNNDHFTIERSTDGIGFTSVAVVKGQATASLTTEYAVTDRQPRPGTSYYRLRQTDVNGSEQVLGLRTITMQAAPVRLSPNPAGAAVDAAFNAGIFTSIRLYTSDGRLLQTVSPGINGTRAHFQLTGYAPGTYYVAFIGANDTKRLVRKLVKR
jgi:hypothetical protein